MEGNFRRPDTPPSSRTRSKKNKSKPDPDDITDERSEPSTSTGVRARHGVSRDLISRPITRAFLASSTSSVQTENAINPIPSAVNALPFEQREGVTTRSRSHITKSVTLPAALRRDTADGSRKRKREESENEQSNSSAVGIGVETRSMKRLRKTLTCPAVVSQVKISSKRVSSQPQPSSSSRLPPQFMQPSTSAAVLFSAPLPFDNVAELSSQLAIELKKQKVREASQRYRDKKKDEKLQRAAAAPTDAAVAVFPLQRDVSIEPCRSPQPSTSTAALISSGTSTTTASPAQANELKKQKARDASKRYRDERMNELLQQVGASIDAAVAVPPLQRDVPIEPRSFPQPSTSAAAAVASSSSHAIVLKKQKSAEAVQRFKNKKQEELQLMPIEERELIQADSRQQNRDRMRDFRARRSESLPPRPPPQSPTERAKIKADAKRRQRHMLREDLLTGDENATELISSALPFMQSVDVEEICETIRTTENPDLIDLPNDIVEILSIPSQINAISNNVLSSMLYQGTMDEDFNFEYVQFSQDFNINNEQDERLFEVLVAPTSRPVEVERITEDELLLRPALSIDETTVQLHYCGLMNVECPYCKALHFDAEKNYKQLFNACCHSGKIKLPTITPNFPSVLRDLLIDPNTPGHRNFREDIRKYNCALRMCSVGTKPIPFRGGGPYSFVIQGQVHHNTTHAVAATGQTPKYAQLYVLDVDDANAVRANHRANSSCDPRIFNDIYQCMVSSGNPFVQIYKNMREIMQAEERLARTQGRQMPNIRIDFRRAEHLLPGQHPRQYNSPLCNEVAMIFVDPNGEPPFERDIRIYRKNPMNSQNEYIQVDINSHHLEPMSYPILRPRGEPGWRVRWEMESYVARERVHVNASKLQYISAIIQVRRGVFNPIMSAGKLFQEWLVDLYAQHQANNLNFIRLNQTKLRVENYRVLQQHQQNLNNQNAAGAPNIPAGAPMILPSTFTGSPRNMAENCRDIMAMFKEKGPPDLFITFTANSRWKEVTENLKEICNDSMIYEPSDRPDLISRVFHLKLKSLMKDITEGEIFGKVQAWAYTIEFQKRGLPHAHILITLHPDSKFTTPQRIDEVVCAKIPDSTRHPVLHEKVMKYMIHGPCGDEKRDAPCMQNNECTKHYPKNFNQGTEVNIAGYPVYNRPRNEPVTKRGKQFDNRHVVPYNPFLLLKYDAHINVEANTSFKTILYLFKYICKGSDRAIVAIGVDETKHFEEHRYLSAPEACHHIHEFKMHDRSHVVYRLAVHLPNEQSVSFEDGEEETALGNSSSTLLAWFKLNESDTDTDARRYLYTEIPRHYTYNSSTKKWKKRVRLQLGDKVIARMHSVPANAGEKFYLRLLLLHKRGATSFKDMRTVDSIQFDDANNATTVRRVHPTFREAAIAMNLLIDDNFARDFLTEAIAMSVSKQVREAFAYILIFHEIPNPRQLWEDFKEQLTVDYTLPHYGNLSADARFNMGLLHINSILNQHSKSCGDYQLDEPHGTYAEDVVDIQTHINEANDRIDSLNTNQLNAFNAIVGASNMDASVAKCFFIDGPGGSGKTYLYQTCISFFKGNNKKVIPLATTGLAATLLPDGNTVHGAFKLPLNINETTVCKPRRAQIEELLQSDIIIIDEVSMMSKFILDAIDRFFRDKLRSDTPFGGKLIVIGGDFRQTLPVVRGGAETASIEMCVKSSDLWQHFQILSLTENMRVSDPNQGQFREFLMQIGNGTYHHVYTNLIQVPSEYLNNSNDMISAIYGNSFEDVQSIDTNSCILSTTNSNILSINNEIIAKLPGNERVYLSCDIHVKEDAEDHSIYPVELLNTLSPSGIPPHKLILKEGAIVMLIRNLNRKKKLCNGTRLRIVAMRNLHVVATKLCDNEEVVIPRIKLKCEDSTLPFAFTRLQLPLIPAFAMTINKSQGQTFDKVGIMLTEPVFSHGQLYVGMSRCRSSNGLKIFVKDSYPYQGNIFKDSRVFTRNIVHRSVISQ